MSNEHPLPSPDNLTSYDRDPYESFSFPQAHLDRLSVVATLLGLTPPSVEKCRVLELGCASGGHLIPMAEALPSCRFVGVDLSSRQVAQGQACIAALRLGNIELQHLSIADATPALGTFDYIICHGVFSWVPHPIQEKIFALCQQLLSPTGIAYISYNTLPGWNMRKSVREMMLFHTKDITDSQQRAQQARAILGFMARTAAAEGSPYANFLAMEFQYLANKADYYLLHEHLDEHNDPMYFHQFVTRARQHDLDYVGEVDVASMVPNHFPRDVQLELAGVARDQVGLEQYMDFARNRMFRQTLLCHKSQQPNYQMNLDRMFGLHIASPLRPVSARPDLASDRAEEFQGPGAVGITSHEPIIKAALTILAEQYPASVAFPKLRSLARSRLQRGSLQDAETVRRDNEMLASTFWRFFATATGYGIQLTTRQMGGASRAGDRPIARGLARWQATQGRYATNFYHDNVELNETQRRLLPRLDGSSDRAALVRMLEECVERQELHIEDQGSVITDVTQRRVVLQRELEQQLDDLARAALLFA